jgi:ketosteroid isomerase-like protein
LTSEAALAKAVVDRNLEYFSSFLSEDIVFYPSTEPIEGKFQVIEYWKAVFELPVVPFTWKVSEVEVAESGRLAFGSGVVFDQDGDPFCEYMTIWRLLNGIGWKVESAALISLALKEGTAEA